MGRGFCLGSRALRARPPEPRSGGWVLSSGPALWQKGPGAASAPDLAHTMIPIHDGLSTLSDRYDAFILDLWGTIHDGYRPLPGAVECLDRLCRAGKRILILSNAPRRAGKRDSARTWPSRRRQAGDLQRGRPPYECGFLDEPLEEAELEQVCVNFEPGRNSAMKRTFAEERPQ